MLILLTDKKDLQLKCDYWFKKNEEANEKIIELEKQNKENAEELKIFQKNLDQRNYKLLRKKSKIKYLKSMIKFKYFGKRLLKKEVTF